MPTAQRDSDLTGPPLLHSRPPLLLLSPTRLSHGSLGVFLLLLLCFASALPSFPLLGTAREGILRCESARHPNGVPAPSPPRAISTLVPAASLASEQTMQQDFDTDVQLH